MWLEAIVTQEDFVQVVGALLPLKIYLDEDEKDEKVRNRWLLLHPAKEVMLVADEGLRVTCPAEVQWTIAGMKPSMKLDVLRVLLRPRVVEKNDGFVLEFQIQVEETDFHSLPEVIDSSIAKAINSRLAEKSLTWDFTKTFTRTVGLGAMFAPVEGLTIGVAWGKQRVNLEVATLVVSFKIGFARSD